MTLVAVSAAYGAAGSVIGPALADRLGVPFVDRGIALAVAEQLELSLDEALALEEPAGGSFLERLLRGFVGADTGAPTPVPVSLVTADDFHRASEEAIRARAESGHGVLLGRGAAAALREDPRVLRVRLTGPREDRLRQAIAVGGVDRDAATRAMRRLDRAHAEYVRQFYGADIDDPALYHVVLDATALPVQACVDVIERAARAVCVAGSG
jgi:cytidylate kinase